MQCIKKIIWLPLWQKNKRRIVVTKKFRYLFVSPWFLIFTVRPSNIQKRIHYDRLMKWETRCILIGERNRLVNSDFRTRKHRHSRFQKPTNKEAATHRQAQVPRRNRLIRSIGGPFPHPAPPYSWFMRDFIVGNRETLSDLITHVARILAGAGLTTRRPLIDFKARVYANDVRK